MSENILYASKNYKLTENSFTYQGHTEPLKNIADLYVVENGPKEKLIAGLTLSVWGLFLSFALGNITTILMGIAFAPESGHSITANAQTISLTFFVTLFFMLGYFLRAKYRLFITKVNGAKGSIDKNRTSREEFDKLISAVKQAISEHC